MEPFTIEIAGLAVQVEPLFASTREYCRKYLSEREPEFFIGITREDLVDTQLLAEREAVAEGIRPRKFPEPFLERATILRKISYELLKRDTIFLHGSTVGLDGAAYLFTAPCRTGKSTHTRFWRESFGPRAVMVNDDRPFLHITDSGVFAYGSPWSGKHGLDTNVCLPLKGICFLRRGTENRIQSVDPEAFLDKLRHQSFVPEDGEGREMALALVDRIARLVPLWEMECTKDPDAAMVSYRAMSGI